jgi:hypothetical protein
MHNTAMSLKFELYDTQYIEKILIILTLQGSLIAR